MSEMTRHTRRILPLFRAITTDRHDAEVTVRRRTHHGYVTHAAVLTVYEMDGRGRRRASQATHILASWRPDTGELFADDGDRVSGGSWDVYREVARANRDALNAVALHGTRYGTVRTLAQTIRTVRPRHFRIAIEGTLSAYLADEESRTHHG